jgi:hypothetical protein
VRGRRCGRGASRHRQPLLQRREVRPPALVGDNDLAIDQRLCWERPARADEFGEPRRQVARSAEQLDSGLATPPQQAAEAVELRLGAPLVASRARQPCLQLRKHWHGKRNGHRGGRGYLTSPLSADMSEPMEHLCYVVMTMWTGKDGCIAGMTTTQHEPLVDISVVADGDRIARNDQSDMVAALAADDAVLRNDDTM